MPDSAWDAVRQERDTPRETEERISQIAGDLMEALNAKGNATTEAEYKLALALTAHFREKRIEEQPK